jgi:ABC-type bacteriocin/lantibiotic exporter with double-glycine peptidase domain
MLPPLTLAPASAEPPLRLSTYVWRVTGWRQLTLALVALLATAANLAPIELQRRIIDRAILPGDTDLLWRLAALYAVAVLAHNLLKFVLKTGQGWLAESAVLRARRALLAHERAGREAGAQALGASVSVLGSELDRLGGFIGAAPSLAVANLAMLAGVLGYMLYAEPQLAAISLLLLLPNLILTPLVQRRLNALTRVQVSTLRDFGDSVVAGCHEGVTRPMMETLYANRMWFHLWKNLLKTLLGLLGAAAPLGALLAGGLMVIAGDATPGLIFAFLSAFNRIAGPIRDLIAFYREAAQAGVRYEMVRGWM